MSTRKLLTLLFSVTIAVAFMVAPSKQVDATKDLKKKHEKNKDLVKEVGKIKCDFCHHKIDDKKKKKLPDNVKGKDDKALKKIKKCTECHDPGKDEVKKYDELPEKLKLVHKKCKECHEKKEYAQEGDKRRKALPKHLKKKSGCRLCHKG